MIIGITEAKLRSAPHPPGAIEQLQVIARVDGPVWWLDDADPRYLAVLDRYGAGKDLVSWINRHQWQGTRAAPAAPRVQLEPRQSQAVASLPPGPLPFDQWPRWAKWVAKRSQPGDVGVGDTFQRLAAKLGGEKVKKLSALVRIPCGCTARQGEWNRRYPYGATG